MRKSCAYRLVCLCTKSSTCIGIKRVVCITAHFYTYLTPTLPLAVHRYFIVFIRYTGLVIPTFHTPYISQKQIKFNILTTSHSGELS